MVRPSGRAKVGRAKVGRAKLLLSRNVATLARAWICSTSHRLATVATNGSVNENESILPVRHTQMARLEYALQAKPDMGLATQGTLANLGFAALNPGLS